MTLERLCCKKFVMQGGRTAHQGERAGTGGGEGPSKGNVKKHNIKIFNHHTDQELDVTVPEDRYNFALIHSPKSLK